MSGIVGVSPNMNSGVLGAHPAGFQKSIAIIGDNKAHDSHAPTMSGGYSDSLTEGTWDIRELNRIFIDEDNIVSISSNKFTLQPAKYFIEWSAPCYNGGVNMSRLYNVTADHIEAHSQTGHTSSSTSNWQGCRVLTPSTAFPTGVASEFKIEHNCQETNVAHGLGHGAYYNGRTATVDGHTIGVFLVVRIHKYT